MAHAISVSNHECILATLATEEEKLVDCEFADADGLEEVLGGNWWILVTIGWILGIEGGLGIHTRLIGLVERGGENKTIVSQKFTEVILGILAPLSPFAYMRYNNARGKGGTELSEKIGAWRLAYIPSFR